MIKQHRFTEGLVVLCWEMTKTAILTIYIHVVEGKKEQINILIPRRQIICWAIIWSNCWRDVISSLWPYKVEGLWFTCPLTRSMEYTSLPCLVRLSGQHWNKVLLWLRSKNRPSPTDSSPTNRWEYANSGAHGNEQKQEVVMISLRVLSSSPACGLNHLSFSI